jgi:hypothetical protein
VQQTIRLRHELEDAQSRLDAEEAIDDPLRMIPYLLDGKAIQGVVRRIDHEHRELAVKREVRRPLVTLACDEPCRMPVGKELYWTGEAGTTWCIHSVENSTDAATVVVKLMTSTRHNVPPIGALACFSVHRVGAGYWRPLPDKDPWTHQISAEAGQTEGPAPLEAEEQVGP